MSALEVTAVGLASSAGLSAEDHRLFLAAESGGGRVATFGEDPALAATAAPWLDEALEPERRAEALAVTALKEVVDEPKRRAIAVAPARLQAVVDRVAQRFELSVTTTCHGDAGIFEALALARQQRDAQRAHPLVLFAVDCQVDEAVARARAKRLSPWRKDPPKPSEAAAAFRLGGEGSALATLHHSATLSGSGSDDDDEPIDGAAMTRLLREGTRGAGLIGASFGPHYIDQLRHLSWSYAAARCFAALDPSCRLICVEDELGRLGDASGAAHLAYAIACRPSGDAAGRWFSAWAVSPDGTRGLCIGEGHRG